MSDASNRYAASLTTYVSGKTGGFGSAGAPAACCTLPTARTTRAVVTAAAIPMALRVVEGIL